MTDKSTTDVNYDRYTEWKDWSGGAARSTRFSSRFRLANRHLTRPLQEVQAGRVCEIGVGSGRLANYLASLGMGVTAIDLNPPPALDPRINFLLGDANLLLTDLRNEPFDAVLAIDMLEHVEPAQLGGLLRAVHGCLKPGGMLLIQVPNAASPLGVSFQEGDFTHRSRFSAASLRQVLMTQGFEVTQCGGAPLPLLPVTSLLSRPAYWVAALFWKLVQSAVGIRGEVFRPNLFVIAKKPA
jgi:2-polyprenyl-3-methyl-5-hydroxy-6-metoxy-1,4-benzoquinol methylase